MTGFYMKCNIVLKWVKQLSADERTICKSMNYLEITDLSAVWRIRSLMSKLHVNHAVKH